MGSSEYETYPHYYNGFEFQPAPSSIVHDYNGFDFQPPPSIIIHKPPSSRPLVNSPDTSFPILLVAIIGILTTAFLLVSYYVFVIKCCLNSQPIGFLRPRRREDDRLVFYASSATTSHENSGLDESVIRAIPIVRYRSVGKGNNKERNFCECAVCLNEFQEEEKLRVLPSCSHAFHIDCIDIWLQSNANCPLCRSSVSITNIQFPSHNPSSSQAHDPFRNTVIGGDENFVIIEMRSGNDDRTDQANDSSEALEQRSNVHKKGRKLHHVSSMGDECIDVRRKDDQFDVQPIRRSISMDSSADRKLYLSVQEILQQSKHFNECSSKNEGSSSSIRTRSRPLFSFGSGRGSRNSVLPLELDLKN